MYLLDADPVSGWMHGDHSITERINGKGTELAGWGAGPTCPS